MEHRLNKKVILFCFSLILVIISLIATPTIYSFLCYEKNQVGESYGKAAEMIDGSGFLKNPDLIEIIADNGKKGYVRKSDYYITQPNNPEEAIVYMKKLSAIPVYKNDGITKIGELNSHIEVRETSNFRKKKVRTECLK